MIRRAPPFPAILLSSLALSAPAFVVLVALVLTDGLAAGTAALAALADLCSAWRWWRGRSSPASIR